MIIIKRRLSAQADSDVLPRQLLPDRKCRLTPTQIVSSISTWK
jgi:hypothetical protein